MSLVECSVKLENCFRSEANLKNEIYFLFTQDDLKPITEKALLLTHYHTEHNIISRLTLKQCLSRLLNDPTWNPWADSFHLQHYLKCGSGYLSNKFLDKTLWTTISKSEIYPLVVRVKKYNTRQFCMVRYFETCHVSTVFDSIAYLDGILHLFYSGLEMAAFALSEEPVDNLKTMIDRDENEWEVVL